MSNIDLKLSPWAISRVSEGKKRSVVRRHPVGKTGDTFHIDGRKYVITKVEKRNLGEIVTKLYMDEGADSPDDLERTLKWIWKTPILDYDLVMVVHWFEREKHAEGKLQG